MRQFADKRADVESIDNLDSKQFQEFLDDSQYKLNGILRYEKIFGRGFISTGGLTTTTVISLKPWINQGILKNKTKKILSTYKMVVEISTETTKFYKI